MEALTGAENEERVIRALRSNRYHRSIASIVRSMRGLRSSEVQVAMEALIAAGRVVRLGDVFRLRSIDEPPRGAALERHETRQRAWRERRAARELREKQERELQALCEALVRAAEHRANVRRVRVSTTKAGLGQHTTLRILLRVAAELGMPLSELIAAAEVRAGLREQTDVFRVFWDGHGKRARP